MMRGWLGHLALFGMLAMSANVHGHRLPQFGNVTPVVALDPAVSPVQPPCAKRVEPFDMNDYNGPFNRLVARISQKVDRVTVHPQGRHTSLKPCSLSVGGKFRLFVNDSVDPINLVGSAGNAGFGQLQNSDPSYGQGAAGYGKRVAAGMADNATGNFFGIFVYPTIFHQDPRYYRVGRGSVKSRLGHALEHRFVTTSDSGKRVFNFSEWSTAISTNMVANLYHPDAPRSAGAMAKRVGFSVANDMGWDVLREFWPEVAHTFKLPFRTHEDDDPPKAPIPAPTPASARNGVLEGAH